MKVTLTAEELLAEADWQLSRGHSLAAGMVCRAALEVWLTDLFDQSGIPERKQTGWRIMLDRSPKKLLARLAAAGVIEPALHIRLRAVLRVLNGAAHGQLQAAGEVAAIVEVLNQTVQFSTRNHATAEKAAPTRNAEMMTMPPNSDIAGSSARQDHLLNTGRACPYTLPK